MIGDRYILVDKRPVPCDDPEAWLPHMPASTYSAYNKFIASTSSTAASADWSLFEGRFCVLI